MNISEKHLQELSLLRQNRHFQIRTSAMIVIYHLMSNLPFCISSNWITGVLIWVNIREATA